MEQCVDTAEGEDYNDNEDDILCGENVMDEID